MRNVSGSAPQKAHEEGQRARPSYHTHGRPGHRGENDDRHARQRQTEKRQPGIGAPVCGRHQNPQPVTPEKYSVHGDRSDQQHRRAHRKSHRDQIGRPQLRSQHIEALLERQRQQESGEQLHPGLNHAQFLQQTVPIAVQAFHFGFAARTAVPPLVVLRIVDVHSCDHRIRRPQHSLLRRETVGRWR